MDPPVDECPFHVLVDPCNARARSLRERSCELMEGSACVRATRALLNAVDVASEHDGCRNLCDVVKDHPMSWLTELAATSGSDHAIEHEDEIHCSLLQRLLAFVFVRLHTGNVNVQQVFTKPSLVSPVLMQSAGCQDPKPCESLQQFLAKGGEAWKAQGLCDLESTTRAIADPCVRQRAILFSLRRVVPAVLVTDSCDAACIEQLVPILLLGISDVWSAIRKDAAPLVVHCVLQFPTVDTIDAFIDRLLNMAIGRETTASGSTTRMLSQQQHKQHVWKQQEGALRVVLLLLKTIRVHHRPGAPSAPGVAQEIRGHFNTKPGTTVVIEYDIGHRHQRMAHLPRALAQATMKATMYHCFHHDQESVRELAAQALVAYVDLCDAQSRLLLFQEVLSKLNHKAKSTLEDSVGISDPNDSLLDVAEAEGLLDVLAKLAPVLPCEFLLKHWKFVFPIIEKYVSHVASSVRQKSCAIVLAFAELSVAAAEAAASVELLMQMIMSLSLTDALLVGQDLRNSVTWQQLEGRLMSIDLLATFMCKNMLWAHARLPIKADIKSRRKAELVAATSSTLATVQWAQDESATWMLEDDEARELAAKQQKNQATPIVLILLNQHMVDNSARPSDVWRAVLRGWWAQVLVASRSNQFELRRMTKQVVPAITRLFFWTSQTEVLENMATIATTEHESTVSLLSTRALLLHVRFLQEAALADNSTRTITFQDVQARASRSSQRLLLLLLSGDMLPMTGSPELIGLQVEVTVMGLLAFASSMEAPHDGNDNDTDRRMLASAVDRVLDTLHVATTVESGLDRLLSVSLVRLLPSLVETLTMLQLLPTERWLPVLRDTALQWLLSDHMLRWITVDKLEAHALLLHALVQMARVPCSVPSPRVKAQLRTLATSRRDRQPDGIYFHTLALLIWSWRHAEHAEDSDALIVDMAAFCSRQHPADKPLNPHAAPELSVWDDWDGDALDIPKQHEVRAMATVDDATSSQPPAINKPTLEVLAMHHVLGTSDHNALLSAVKRVAASDARVSPFAVRLHQPSQ